jgi:hypothetical protein
MKKQILVVASLAIFIFSCGDIEESINKTTESLENKIEEKKEKIRTKIEIKEFYAWVDKLRVRAVPGLESKRQGAKFVDVLDEGEKVTFLGEKSSETFEVSLRGRTMNAPFYKVRTKNGKVGWIFAGALSSFPVDVEHYRVAIAFNEGYSEDFSYYYSEANRLLLPTGVDLVFVDSNFEEVNIRNIKGEIIGTENISKYVRKYKSGILCVEKGEKSEFISYSPDMGYDVISHFGVGYCGGDL